MTMGNFDFGTTTFCVFSCVFKIFLSTTREMRSFLSWPADNNDGKVLEQPVLNSEIRFLLEREIYIVARLLWFLAGTTGLCENRRQ